MLLIGNMVQETIKTKTIIALFCLLSFLLVFTGCQTTEKKAPQQVKPVLKDPTVGGSIALSGKYRTVTVADLNSDGILDIIGGVVGRPSVAIWYGQPGGFVSKPVFLPFKADVHSIAAADVNEDGLKDLILAVHQEISGVMVWLNSKDGSWVRGETPTNINEYQSVRTADIHFDWMFESDQVLRTWSTAPFDLLDAETDIEIDCHPLADHRVDYLDFEGEISGGRGTVSPTLAGTYRLIQANNERFQVLLQWDDTQGESSAKVEIYRSARPDVGLRPDESCGCWRLRFSPGR
jgi:hypothetical protein